MTNTKTAEVVWEEPPAVNRGPGKHNAFFEALRNNPGKSARFPGSKGKSGAASAINAGKYTGTSKGEFEAVTRNVDGETVTYVKYVGKARRRGSTTKE